MINGVVSLQQGVTIMEKKLIVKIKMPVENTNKIQCSNHFNKWEICGDASFSDIVACSFSRYGEYDVFYDLVQDVINRYDNVKELLKHGFTIRIDKTENEYGLIVSKGKCSTSFSVKKDKGIAKLLIQADDWAQTLLEDLNIQV